MPIVPIPEGCAFPNDRDAEYDPSGSYPDLRDIEIDRLSLALNGYAIPRLEFCAARFREMANDKTLEEPWRNACSLWAILVNGTLEFMASSAKNCVANSSETAEERALPNP